MPIMESDILRVRKGDMTYLLLRGSERFFLIKEDAASTDAKRERLLRLFPCDVSQMQRSGLHFSTFRGESLRHIVLEGTCAGDGVELWIGGDVRKFRLAEDRSDEAVRAFFDGYPITFRSSDKRPPSKTFRYITWTLNGIAVICSVLFLFVHKPYQLWSVLCILCQLASIVLIYSFPRNFVFDDSKDAVCWKENKREDITIALLAPGVSLTLRTVTDMTFVGDAFWRLMCISAVVFAAAFLPMILISGRTRNRLATSIALTVLMMFLGIGTIGQLDHLLAYAPSENHTAEMIEKRTSSGIKVGSYYCTVELPGEGNVELIIPAEVYAQVDIGEKITVLYYDGAFGIPYYMVEIG